MNIYKNAYYGVHPEWPAEMPIKTLAQTALALEKIWIQKAKCR